MANYYPDQTIILPMTTIRRNRMLPPDVVGEVVVEEGQRVSALDVVARGVRINRYVVVDLAAHFGTDDPEALDELLQVRERDIVKRGDPLAGTPRNRRNVVKAPVSGMVAQVLDGRLVLQSGLTDIELRAGFRGAVISVRGNRGIVLEATGGLVQGAWGNGQSHMGALKMEPKDGLAALEVDEFSNEWRGAVVLTQHTLDHRGLTKAEAQGVGGIVAPSMSVDLRKVALRLKIPIILTEGFGTERMNRMALSVLEGYDGRQVALNAEQPNRWKPDRPEVIIPATTEERRIPTPSASEPLREGAEVRITRTPYAGVIGRITNLPDTPHRLENGLRLSVAEVTLPSGRVVDVPLVNLELFGRG